MSDPKITGLDKNGVLAAAVEAEKEPTKFSPRERAAYVKERVDEVRRLRALGQNDEEIKAALGTFVTQFPTLFQYAVEPHFDYKQFEKMLSMLDKMGSGLSQHQASVQVGQILVDKYVKPMLR
jgi:hypothetical protein